MSPYNQVADLPLSSSYDHQPVEYVDERVDESLHYWDLDDNSPAGTFSYRVVKRALDIFIVLLIAPLVLSVGAVIALCVAIDSPGPVFFSHQRVKRRGQYFHMWKFRTMCQDASSILEQHLERHPERRKEWQLHHKLKVDPRISAVGAFLRRKSLDELPQIWNVLTGTMSLVGPRPIVTAEIARYGTNFVYYTAVKPGITGLWQISGRSNLTYAQRVALDRQYVENWSLWLELKILLRTFKSVARSDGAY
ncbi:Undecaprenyl-phosphate galactose phosphotransferase WbaP [Granulicella aggregans]|uniref:Undecaprenyl-phosphate galactose phosphotransferase WbaP n=1 Tax=Granulicella aggregans TaxID=474949 RepID=A0A7W8E3B0_9BACT|nr:sugar transferase [Granulicella aggregans]MBB5057271.1 Undecaprenyl-phosphate galactose phosphotransferase WbaP [Granulicella aggregans]